MSCDTFTLRQAIDRLPRYPLSHLPTPLEYLPRLSKALGGPRIYVKRDDCTGLACGGNKARHNEFLLGDALAQGADIFVWGAGVQSNNCRQTAAACAKAGLDCHLVLGRGRPADGPDELQGNLLLDHLVGAKIEIVPESLGPDLDRRIAEQAEVYRAQGRKPYYWESDRVKPLAAVSYALCLLEILEQSSNAGIEPAAVYVSSAGSTGSGLALARYCLGLKFPTRSVAPLEWPWDTRADMARIANLAAGFLGLNERMPVDEIDVTFDFIAPGYGKMSSAGDEAMTLMARTEGILLDPIYTAKALAGLIRDIRQGKYSTDHNVFFIHTGGIPALFAYNQEIASRIPAK